MSFIHEFEKLCNKVGKAPTKVCLEVGLSDAIYTSWRKKNSTPRPATLRKIADYFGVDEQIFTQSETSETSDGSFEKLLLKYYAMLDDEGKLEVLTFCKQQALRQEALKQA